LPFLKCISSKHTKNKAKIEAHWIELFRLVVSIHNRQVATAPDLAPLCSAVGIPVGCFGRTPAGTETPLDCLVVELTYPSEKWWT